MNPMNMRWKLDELEDGRCALVCFEFDEVIQEELERTEYASKGDAEDALLFQLKEADEAWEAKQVEVAPIRQRARRLRQLAQRLGHRV